MDSTESYRYLLPHARAMFSHLDWSAMSAGTPIITIDQNRDNMVARLQKLAQSKDPEAVIKKKVLKRIVEEAAREFDYHRVRITGEVLPYDIVKGNILPPSPGRDNEYWVKGTLLTW